MAKKDWTDTVFDRTWLILLCIRVALIACNKMAFHALMCR